MTENEINFFTSLSFGTTSNLLANVNKCINNGSSVSCHASRNILQQDQYSVSSKSEKNWKVNDVVLDLPIYRQAIIY